MPKVVGIVRSDWGDYLEIVDVSFGNRVRVIDEDWMIGMFPDCLSISPDVWMMLPLTGYALMFIAEDVRDFTTGYDIGNLRVGAAIIFGYMFHEELTDDLIYNKILSEFDDL